jgi:2-(1,2-epoxy-1,2-dihydrophenyl)acetyl-CoA isomerase
LTHPVLTELDNGVLTVTLNNPEVRNAFTHAMGMKLIAELKDAEADPGVRVVVLTGAGDAFCAGGDVRSLGSVDPDDKVAVKWGDDPIWGGMEQRTLRVKANGAITTLLHAMGKPTVAMVRGPAAGAGLAMAAACDFRIAGESAFFTTAYAKIGASGDLGAAYYLSKLLGPTRARELMFFSEKVRAAEALAIGLVSKVVPDDMLAQETRGFASKLADGPPIALRYIKQNLLAAEAIDLDAYLEAEARSIIRCFQTDDSKEAIKAFREKRPPVFTGR